MPGKGTSPKTKAGETKPGKTEAEKTEAGTVGESRALGSKARTSGGRGGRSESTKSR